MLRRLYDRVLALSARPDAAWWLAGVSFAEASFFPIPPDVLLIAMVLAKPSRAWRLAALCTVASVAGGALGWVIGNALFTAIAQPLLHLYHYEAAFATFQDTFARYGIEIILLKGLTPIPYKIVTIAAGAAHFNFAQFMAASLVTRGFRFFLVATLLHFFGDRVRVFIERRLTLVMLLVLAGIVGGFLVLKLL